MPRVSPIQESFAAGEISKDVRARVSSDVYKQALKFCENWVPQVQGPVRMRDSFRYRDDMDSRNNAARLFTFQVGLNEDYIIEVGDQFVIVRNSADGEQVTGGASVNLVVDPTYQSELTSWSFTNNFYINNTVNFGPSELTWQHGQNTFGTTINMNNNPGLPEPEPEAATGGDLRQLIQVPTGSEALQHDLTLSYGALLTVVSSSSSHKPDKSIDLPILNDGSINLESSAKAN